MKPLVLFLVGPTASGKTAAGIELAKLLNGEIVSADSMQVYKGMNIGTAKPSRAERKKIPHHLIDIVPASKNFSVFQFYRAALKAIKQIHRNGKIAIVVGGTGLYVRSLVQGLTPGPSANPALRNKLMKIAAEKGMPFLHQELQKKNPERAAELNPNDSSRIIRALEICEAGPSTKPRLKSLGELGYEFHIAGLSRDREKLRADIDRRVDVMFRKGLAGEALRLKKGRVSKTAAQALGYKELWEAARQNRLPEEARDEVKLRTRQFAKRQMTWFRKEPGIQWVSGEGLTPRQTALEILKKTGLSKEDI